MSAFNVLIGANIAATGDEWENRSPLYRGELAGHFKNTDLNPVGQAEDPGQFFRQVQAS
jgi:hypothetical protein